MHFHCLQGFPVSWSPSWEVFLTLGPGPLSGTHPQPSSRPVSMSFVYREVL